MGEVYRARDSRLDREVALKVLPAAFAADADRISRFEREARALAALNHPHVAQVYGLETHGAERVLVMELVPGESLALRLARGPIPVAEALELARQIASGLEAAHEQGIVHRDLKPGNVQITPGGAAKILDFGLAKTVAPVSSGTPAATAGPTITALPATELGQVLGTPAYMSPEQARGQAVDRRTDIWAFGCVVFEMITGRAVFGGVSVADTVAGVLERDPVWDRLPASTPLAARQLLRRCLTKNPARRLHDIADARIEIEDALAHPPGVDRTLVPVGRRRNRMLDAAAAVALVATGGLATWMLLPAAPEQQAGPSAATVLSLPLSVPASVQIDARLGPMLAMSPDGSRLAYVGALGGDRRLYLRGLDQDQATVVEGSEGASRPVFSPDGGWVAFAAEGGLSRVRVDRGVAKRLVPGRGLDLGGWDAGSVVYASGLRFLATAGPGQSPTELLGKGSAAGYRQFDLLPGARAVVASYRLAGSQLTDDPSSVGVVSLADGAVRPLVERGGSPRVVASRGEQSEMGHLLYAQGNQVWAAPFHRGRGELLGPAVAVLRNVMMRSNGDAAQFAVSGTGTLVFLDASPTSEIVRLDADGSARQLSRTHRPFAMPRLSPDGRRLAVEVQDVPHQIWVLDLERDALSRLTVERSAHNFAWHPRGDGIIYTSSLADGRTRLAWRWIDRPGAEVIVLDEPASSPWVTSWSDDGKRLALFADVAGQRRNVYVLPVDGGAPPKPTGPLMPVATTPFDEWNPAISPDGRVIAYISDETGRDEVYVQSLVRETRIQVSVDGGGEVQWLPGGDELYFRSGVRLMKALVSETPTLRVSTPVELVSVGGLEAFGTTNYAISRDGRWVAGVRPVQAPGTQYLNIRFNWFDELNRVAPIR